MDVVKPHMRGKTVCNFLRMMIEMQEMNSVLMQLPEMTNKSPKPTYILNAT